MARKLYRWIDNMMKSTGQGQKGTGNARRKNQLEDKE